MNTNKNVTLTDLLHDPIDTFTFIDIEQFCEEKEPEGIQLDYKKELPKDIAKQIQSFANTRGGLIIVGIEENGKTGLPEKCEGIPQDSKILDKIYQHIARVQPLPNCKVVTTNEKDGNVFVLIRILEGDATPYYVENSPGLYIRTGNISDPIDLASPEASELLYDKREKASFARASNESITQDIVRAFIDKSEQKRKLIIAQNSGAAITSPRPVFQYPMGTNTGLFSILIQPYFPREVLISQYELRQTTTRISRKFPVVAKHYFDTMTRIQTGIAEFSSNETRGYVDCDQIFSNGLIFSLKDLVDMDYDGRKVLPLYRVAELLFSRIVIASEIYKEAGYQGKLSGFIEAIGLSDTSINYIGYTRPSFASESVSLLPTYLWEFSTDTFALSNDKTRDKFFMDLMNSISWTFNYDPSNPEAFDKWTKSVVTTEVEDNKEVTL